MRCSDPDLLLRADAVQQPVGDVLAGNAQRGAVFHQADVVDVGHLGAADALIDPAHDIAQQPLRVVVEFLAHFVFRPVRARRQRHGQQRVQPGRFLLRHVLLDGEDIDLVIVRGVQRRGRGRGHPGGVGAGLRMADLLVQHVAHHVRRGPHALADLRLAGRPQARPMQTLRFS
jgi:hypothetical protein